MNRRRRHSSRAGRTPSAAAAAVSRRAADARIPLTSGRLLAWRVLGEYDRTGRFLFDLFRDLDGQHCLSSRERGLAVDIAAGTVRHRRTIDVILKSQVRRPRSDVEPDLWRILQMGVVQIVFGRTPDHAAVDRTVELTRDIGRGQWAGFVNGVLRSVGRLLSDRMLQEPSRRAVALPDGTWRELNADLFSCPVTGPDRYFGEAFSFPRLLARRWQQRLSPDDLWKAGFHSLKIPQLVLRVNTLKAATSDVIRDLQEVGCDVVPGRYEEAVRVTGGGRPEQLPGYADGLWSVQDESAMTAVRLLDPQPGERILDLCAAPGGKTTYLAEWSGDEAVITACDVSAERLERLRASIDRLGLKSVDVRQIGRSGEGLPEEPFDAVLVDAPCSNTGVLARRPEARWRFREKDLSELTVLQTRLLMTAFDRVRPGGRIVYSVCSIEPEETTHQVAALTAAVPGMICETERLQLPGQPADGGYAAVLRRRQEAESAGATRP